MISDYYEPNRWYSAWEFCNSPHDDFDIVPMVLPFVLPPFPTFFYKYIQVYKPIRNLRILCYILKNVSNAIILSNSHGSPTYVIHNRKNRIGTTRKASDVQQFCLCLYLPGDQALNIEYIYSDTIWFIVIPIGEKLQQGNVTPKSVWSRMCSFWYWTSNLLAWKIIFPASPPLSKEFLNWKLKLFEIFQLGDVTRTKFRTIIR